MDVLDSHTAFELMEVLLDLPQETTDPSERKAAKLLLLEKSAILCCPGSGRVHHYPKNLIHCFIDDSRSELKNLDGIILKVELFSISPNEEQLCWECSCRSELEVPEIQRKSATWLTWLNQ